MMQQPVAAIDVARRLLAAVARDVQRPEELAEAAHAAYRRLRERLALLLGQGGFDALWARAVHQARLEAGLQNHPPQEGQPLAGDGGLHALVQGADLAASRERLVAVFGVCVELLYTFIGHDLGFRLVQQTWPDVPLGEPQGEGEATIV